MSSKPIIAIVGATGGQGSSVLNSVLQDGNYQVRGLTRNPSGAAAQALKEKGVEVVKADLNDYDSLVAAFKDASIVYAVTDFFEPFVSQGAEKAIQIESQQGINLAKAASATPTLKHYIWSTLANVNKISGGKYVIPHFDGKNLVDEYIRSDKGLLEKTTFLWVSFYGTNYMYPVFQPVLIPSTGKHVLLQPTPASTLITTIGDQRQNVGPFVLAIIKQPHLTQNGKIVLAATETLTNGDLLKTWSEVTGKPSEYVEISLEAYCRLWPGFGDEMGPMMKFWEEFGDKSWDNGTEGVVTAKELGVDIGKLVGIRETLRDLKWE